MRGRSGRQGAPPILIVLSGPSGVGKDAVLSRMKELDRPYHFTVTATTRGRRPNERDGVDYMFITRREFDKMLREGELLEWAQVYGNMYGVPKAQVRDALSQGRDVIVKADVQGAATLKRLVGEGLFIFLAPPSIEELARRLGERLTESPEELRTRLRTAEHEMDEASKFDYVVVNRRGCLDEAVREIEDIVDRERRRTPARCVRL